MGNNKSQSILSLVQILEDREADIDSAICKIFEPSGGVIPSWFPESDRRRVRDLIGKYLPAKITPISELQFAIDVLSWVTIVRKIRLAKETECEKLTNELLLMPVNPNDAVYFERVNCVVEDGEKSLPLLLGLEATKQVIKCVQESKAAKAGRGKRGSEGELKRVIRRLAGMVPDYDELLNILDDERYSASEYDDAVRSALIDPIDFMPEEVDRKENIFYFRLNGKQTERSLKTIKNIFISLK